MYAVSAKISQALVPEKRGYERGLVGRSGAGGTCKWGGVFVNKKTERGEFGGGGETCSDSIK